MLKFDERTTLIEWIQGSLLEADYQEKRNVFIYLFGCKINGVEHFDKIEVPDTQTRQHLVFLSAYDAARRALVQAYARAGITVIEWVQNDVKNIHPTTMLKAMGIEVEDGRASKMVH